MASISLEAFDVNLRGKYTIWILPSQDTCSLPNGFQDQILSGTPTFQTSILLMSKQDSRAWLLSYSWDMTFTPESPTDWSLLLSILQHLKKPILIVTTPKTQVPPVFWQKCITTPMNAPTCVSLKYLPSESNHSNQQISALPHSIFYPTLDTMTEIQFSKIPSILSPVIQQSIQSIDLRSLYRELRGAGASLCLSLTDSRFASNPVGISNGTMPSYNATWFYPENNAALRLHISDLRMILRTVTDRLTEASIS